MLCSIYNNSYIIYKAQKTVVHNVRKEAGRQLYIQHSLNCVEKCTKKGLKLNVPHAMVAAHSDKILADCFNSAHFFVYSKYFPSICMNLFHNKKYYVDPDWVVQFAGASSCTPNVVGFNSQLGHVGTQPICFPHVDVSPSLFLPSSRSKN